MDRVRAIEVLKPLVNSYVDYANITMKEEDDDTAEALEMAIEALKKQLSCEGTTKGATSDTISRQAAIDEVMKYGTIWMEYTDAMSKDEIAQIALNNAKSTMIRILKELPTIQPERAEGHWINGKCDRCGGHAPFWAMASTYHESNYCPNCGAKMKGGAG